MEFLKARYEYLIHRYGQLSFQERGLWGIMVVVCVWGVLLVGPFSAPTHFTENKTVRIEKGFTIQKTAYTLESQNIIRSAFLFKIFSTLGGGHIIAGDYYFSKPQNVIDIFLRIRNGEQGLAPVRITIPEGLSSFEIATLVQAKFSLFNAQEFVRNAPEGYLFPDTYFFLPNASAQVVIERMHDNFNEKIAPLADQIQKSGQNLADIVVMASIIEEEAKIEKDRQIISGILWKRIKIGMPLQVDATFRYINGKHTYTLTKEDLKTDSPYNTYTNKGLPPTPIVNPGLSSLKAAISPTETDYLYFLSDLKGNTYYAKDFEGHQRNRELYLRK